MSDDQLTPSSETMRDLNVNVQGGQIGSGNTMNNLWLRDREVDAARVEHLASHAAADYVSTLLPEDAAFVLATAAVNPAAGVLRVLLITRKDLAMEVLTRVNREKAAELVAAIGADGEWLRQLPLAAEAVAACRLGASGLGDVVQPLSLANASQQGTNGYFQSFTGGVIHWCERGGAQVTRSPIAAYHVDRGGSGGELGFPLTAEAPAQTSPFGTDGSLQRFESRRSYHDSTCERLGTECGATVYQSDAYGAHATGGGIGEYYEFHGGTGGPLGFPVDDVVQTEPSRRDTGPGTVGWRQRFESGVIYYSDKTKAVLVPNAVAEHHELHGGVTGDLGFPVSSELTAAPSPSGAAGRYQRFEARSDYSAEVTAGWGDDGMPAGATIYTSDEHGVHCVGWGNGDLHEKAGGTGGWLGFPTSDEIDSRESASSPWCTIQRFEGGAIFYKESHGSVPVSQVILDYIASQEGLRQQLGFPVEPERILDPGKADRLQFFEHGLITIRDGVQASWLRLVPKHPAETCDVPEHPAETYDRQVEASMRRLLPGAGIAREPVRSDTGADFAIEHRGSTIFVETKWRPDPSRPFEGSTLPQLLGALPSDGKLLIVTNADTTGIEAQRYIASFPVRSRIVRWRDRRDDTSLGKALIALLHPAT